METERRDVVARVTRFNRGRDRERLALKWKTMQEDALGFFRGTCHLFAEDWPASSPLNRTPPAWVCGDLHIENFGAYRGENRHVYFDIADFDESVLAPCSWDLTRLATSALIAAKTRNLKRKEALGLCHLFLDAYVLALRDGKSRSIERATAQGLIRSLLHRVEGLTQGAFIRERTERRGGKTMLRVPTKRTLPATDGDRSRVKRFLRAFAQEQEYPELFKTLDVVRRIAGTGALGLERYTILVEGWGRTGGHALLDLKFAASSALAQFVKEKQPRWKSDAERVVAAAQRMQAVSPAFLHPVSIDGKPYVLRELMPTEDKLDIKHWRGAVEGLNLLARDLGFLVAWSELRSGGRNGSATIDELIEFGEHKKWRNSVLEYAEHYLKIAWSDWKAFRGAYHDGALEFAPN
jgi:uncharacterized protein (DUF2252 family)